VDYLQSLVTKCTRCVVLLYQRVKVSGGDQGCYMVPNIDMRPSLVILPRDPLDQHFEFRIIFSQKANNLDEHKCRTSYTGNTIHPNLRCSAAYCTRLPYGLLSRHLRSIFFVGYRKATLDLPVEVTRPSLFTLT